MGVQALAAELAVEAFDKAVIRRLAWPGKVLDHLLVIGPHIQIT